jgi:hypothetical protein
LKDTESNSESEVKIVEEQVNTPSLSQEPSTLTRTEEPSVWKSHLQRCRTWLRTNWSGVTATLAIFIALLAYFEAKATGAATRLHNKLSVRPYMGLSFNANNKGAGVVRTLSGPGPAIVNAFDVTVDGKPVKTWTEALKALDIPEVTDATQAIPIPGTYLQASAGSTNTLLWLKEPPAARAALAKNIGRLGIRLVYCSLYDECWETTLARDELEPRPVPKQKPTVTFGVSQAWLDGLSQVK